MQEKNPRYYSAPTLLSLSHSDLVEALGPVQTQYATTATTVSLSDAGCLPVSAVGATHQDNWAFDVRQAPVKLKVFVDSVPGAVTGTLDPKMALYQPGATPQLGAFNGYTSADCGGNCVVFDGLGCSDPNPTLAGNACPFVEVSLTTPGTWTLAVAPESAAGQGCYQITVEGAGVSQLRQVADNGSVVFAK